MKIFSFLWFADYCTFYISSSNSSSQQASTNTTTNVDKRLVADNGSIGISADHSTVTLLDGGAINQAFNFAGDAGIAALDFANKSLSSMLALAVERDKVTTAAAAAVTDSAMASINQIGQSSQVAVDAAKAETGTTAASYQKLLIVGAVAAAGIWGLNK